MIFCCCCCCRYCFWGVIELVDALNKHGEVQCHCQQSPTDWAHKVYPVVVMELHHDEGGGEGAGGVETAAGEGSHEEHTGQNHEAS